jgi:hypothetical protein
MKRGTKVQGMIEDKLREANKNKIQIKVTLITLTDLATWVPFCILAWAYTNGVDIEKEKIYQIAAVFLLPMNSIMNPIIYNELPKKFRNSLEFFTTISQVHTNHSNKSGAGQESSVSKIESSFIKTHNVQQAGTGPQAESNA